MRTFDDIAYWKIDPYPNKKHQDLVSFRDGDSQQISINIVTGEATKWSLPYALVDMDGELFFPDLAHPDITPYEQEAIDEFLSHIGVHTPPDNPPVPKFKIGDEVEVIVNRFIIKGVHEYNNGHVEYDGDHPTGDQWTLHEIDIQLVGGQDD